MRILTRTAAALLACLAGAASADTTLVYDSDDGEFILRLRPGELRIDDPGPTWQLYREAEDSLYTVDPETHRYRRMDPAAARALKRRIEDLRARMEAQLAALPQAQRRAVRAALAEQLPELEATGGETATEATGATDTVAGRACRVVEVRRDQRLQGTLCVATPAALEMPEPEFATLAAMFRLMGSLLAGTGFEHGGLPFLALDGVPVRYADAGTGAARTLHRLGHEPIPDRVFEIPAEYRAASITKKSNHRLD